MYAFILLLCFFVKGCMAMLFILHRSEKPGSSLFPPQYDKGIYSRMIEGENDGG